MAITSLPKVSNRMKFGQMFYKKLMLSCIQDITTLYRGNVIEYSHSSVVVFLLNS